MEWIYEWSEWFIFAIWSALESTIRKDGKKVNVLYIVDQNHQRPMIVVNHSRNFKERHLVHGGYNRELFIREEEIIVRNWKKGKTKTKNLSKTTIIIRWTRALSTISSRQNQISAGLEVWNYCMYIFTKKTGIAASIYLTSKNKCE